MENFYKETGLKVDEWTDFQKRMCEIYGRERWKNRRSGRTPLSQEDRITMTTVLEDIRNNH